MKTKLRAVLALIIAAAVLVTAAQVMASSGHTATNEQELTGVVTAITPTTLTIDGLVFDIAQA